MVAILAFWLLFGLTLCQPQQRHFLRQKSKQDWLLDGLGLCIQGGLIPLVQIILSLQLYQGLFPQLKGCLELAPWVGIIISFVGVDYLYYWNHRLLHQPWLFPIHAVHHTVTQMDMLGTSRNTLWSSFFLPYVWVNSLMVYLLQDSRGYALGIFLTYLLDLWRHSCLNLPPESLLFQWFNPWLILPQDHAQHHEQKGQGNFGANLKLWDRLHHTSAISNPEEQVLGITLELNLAHKLLWPFPFT
jgi:sterol desaturase/sphingolipid hydroxylase (fatty acid hydroxylase superfamily)